MNAYGRRVNARGYILLEVLVTIVILVVGLLGVAGLQLRTSVAEMEGYQRAQALVLAQDMVDRMNANRPPPPATPPVAYVSPYLQNDIGTALADCTGKTGADLDLCEWGNALYGASEKQGGTSVGTLLGGRGCITAGVANEYFVTVVWQGLVPTVAPDGASPASPCGANQYGNEALRRAVTMRVFYSTLSVGTL